MIKYETIISNFDDKTTLYNWLRKVEEALKHASATNFVVNKKGNATLSFSITFADGTTLESGDIVLQQGESVDDARIASGILQLHLTNGTWLTAGNIKPVSNFSIDASQHLIVNYQDGTSQDLGAIFNGNINISGDLAVTGDITGSKVDCTLVTGDEIVEKMSGYSFENIPSANVNKNVNFAGAVKNGNKLTFVVACDFKRVDDQAGSLGAFAFNFPQAVGEKLYPSALLGNNCLTTGKLILTTDIYGNGVTCEYSILKYSNTRFTIYIYSANNMVLNTDYYGRIEVTFLLSDNLAQ
ncbi:MAG: hypothetical protein J5598_02255 [Clostridia bacterium]|nr:hypothetical protein [Clostridia bacterium]